MRLTKASALAEQWDMAEDELKRRVRRYGWPVVKLSRVDWRFTDQQIEQIVAMQSRASKPAESRTKKTASTGQSRRSASRAT